MECSSLNSFTVPVDVFCLPLRHWVTTHNQPTNKTSTKKTMKKQQDQPSTKLTNHGHHISLLVADHFLLLCLLQVIYIMRHAIHHHATLHILVCSLFLPHQAPKAIHFNNQRQRSVKIITLFELILQSERPSGTYLSTTHKNHAMHKNHLNNSKWPNVAKWTKKRLQHSDIQAPFIIGQNLCCQA